MCVQPCDCAQEDLYCEYGYEKMTSSKCGPMLFGQPPVCAAIAADYYTMSSTHLRLTHHETCPNLSSFIPDTDGSVRPCSSSPATFDACRRCDVGWPRSLDMPSARLRMRQGPADRHMGRSLTRKGGQCVLTPQRSWVRGREVAPV